MGEGCRTEGAKCLEKGLVALPVLEFTERTLRSSHDVPRGRVAPAQAVSTPGSDSPRGRGAGACGIKPLLSCSRDRRVSGRAQGETSRSTRLAGPSQGRCSPRNLAGGFTPGMFGGPRVGGERGRPHGRFRAARDVPRRRGRDSFSFRVSDDKERPAPRSGPQEDTWGRKEEHPFLPSPRLPAGERNRPAIVWRSCRLAGAGRPGARGVRPGRKRAVSLRAEAGPGPGDRDAALGPGRQTVV